MAERMPRGTLLRWLGWFGLANAVVLALVSLRYFQGFTAPEGWLATLYLLLIYPGHYILVAVASIYVLVTLWVLVVPRRGLITFLAVLWFAVLIAGISLDSLLWAESRFHLNGLTAQILGWQSWVFAAVMLLIGLVFEALLAGRVWRFVLARPARKGGWVALLCVLTIVTGQLIHAWADAAYHVPVTSVGQQLPVYEGFTAKRQLVRLGLVDPDASREREVARRLSRQLDERSASILDYPKQPLRCDAGSPLNLLLIVADAWRSDLFSATATPALWQYAHEHAAVFNQHFSGGNSSRMGVFSLFYGLPPGYWSSFESLQRSSVLMDELQSQGFQFGIFSSSTLYRPVSLDRTAFSRIPNLRLQSEPVNGEAWQRDRTVRQDWSQWLQDHVRQGQQDQQQPFFGFLFFDASNAMSYPPEYAELDNLRAAAQPELNERFANYQRSIRFIDDEISAVLEELSELGFADNTVVVITSDHGEEFDDSGAGLRDHGSGYTRYQLQVPLLVRWPGRPAQEFNHRSSHYDIVPTLMRDLLGCENPVEHFASGRNLYSAKDWDWLLAGSYYNYAVLEPDQITVTYPNGQFEVRDWDYRLSKTPSIRADVLQAVAAENKRFYP